MYTSTNSVLHMVASPVTCHVSYLQMAVHKLSSKLEKSSATQGNRDSGPPGEACLLVFFSRMRVWKLCLKDLGKYVALG